MIKGQAVTGITERPGTKTALQIVKDKSDQRVVEAVSDDNEAHSHMTHASGQNY